MSEIAVTGPTLRREVDFRGGGFLEVPRPLYSWIAFAGILVVWQAAVSWGWIDPVFLPRPLRLLNALPRNAVGKITREAALRAARSGSNRFS